MRLKLPSTLTVLTSVLVVLLPALALLQYRWVGQVSDAERERMQRTLRVAAAQFREAFDDEIGGALTSLRVDATTVRENAWYRYRERYADWADGAEHPGIIADVFLVDAENGTVRLRRWNPTTETFNNALAKSPQWKNTLLVITYDEHGGFFDHVPPPSVTDERAEFRQLGFRVPTMVIGPYVKQNYVSSVQYDHTSALKHLQTTFALDPLNERMNSANDLMDCIDMERLAANDPAPPITLPTADRFAWPTTDTRCRSSGGFREEPAMPRHEVVRRLREQFPDD